MREDYLGRLRGMRMLDKLSYTQKVIKEFMDATNCKTYVSFSGGKDSTVLLHIVRDLYPDAPAVFIDTGCEYPEIIEQVKRFDNVTILRPEKSFRDVVIEDGYPVIGKLCSHWIDLARRGLPSGIKQMSQDGKFGYKRYAYLLDAPFKINSSCCETLKRKPLNAYEKATGNSPFIGTRTDESTLRYDCWVKYGDNRMTKPYTSNPLSIWKREDEEEYIKMFNVPIASIYERVDRTGCMYCMFGIMADKNRFVLMKELHPECHEYAMRSIGEGGLGMKPVLNFMNIPTGLE